MNALTTVTSFYPGSSQLKLAFCCRRPPVAFVRRRFPVVSRRANFATLVIRSSAVNGNGVDQRSSGNSSWTKLTSSADEFSGWVNDEEERQTSDSKPRQSLVGILAAGAAGIVLVAGLTFAALSLSRRSTSKVKQEMEPLTTEQAKALSSDNDLNLLEEGKDGEKVGMPISDAEENKTGINKDPSLYKENSDVNESRVSDDTGVRQSSEDVGGSSEAVQRESAISDILASAEASDKTHASDITDSNRSVDFENPSEAAAEKLVETKILEYTSFDVESESAVTDNPNVVSSLSEVEGLNLSANRSSVELSLINIAARSELNGINDASIIQEEFVESEDVLSSRDVEKSKELSTEKIGPGKNVETSADGDDKSLEGKTLTGTVSTGSPLVPKVAYPSGNETVENDYNDINVSTTYLESADSGKFFTSAGIPAPSVVSAALQTPPGKVLVPAAVDQLQSQAFSALQILKVVEDDIQPGDLCTRREYARWLVLASSALSRNTTSKVYPAMYIENASELAFDDITPEDPDFPSIQGLAEAGLIYSRLSRRDMQPFPQDDESPIYFSPESPLSRQDVVSWKMALEKRQLPEVGKKNLQQLSGFIDIDKINPDAWPALAADLGAGEQSITTLAFGYTRLFQPDKPVTKAQAAIALSTGDAFTIVSEELARIEAESMAEKAVAAHSALVSQVEKDLNVSYEQKLSLEKEKINAVEKMAEEARREVEKLRVAREEEKLSLMKERAAVDSEMEVLSRLRQEVEKQLQTLMADKVEASYEKEWLNKLRKDAETENQEIARLQYELEVERKALSLARAWAEDEAKRAREQAKALDEAREHWERQGLKVVVDKDLQEEAEDGVTWLAAGKQFSVEETVERSETLVDRLRRMADEVSGRCKETINKIIEKITILTSDLKRKAGEFSIATKSSLESSIQGMKQSSAGVSTAVIDRTKRVAGDWKEGVERLSQRFKT